MKPTAHDTDTAAPHTDKTGHDMQVQLRAVFAKTRDAILLADNAGRYAQANPAAERILGYTRDELLRLSVSDVVVRTVSVDEKILWNDFVNDGQQTGVIELKRKDGATVFCRYDATANILPGLHLSILTDVTEQRKAESRLLESEERFRTLIEHSSDVIFLTNADGLIAYASPSVKRVLGYDDSEIVGRSTADLVHPDDLALRATRRKDLLKTPNGTVTDTARLWHKDGSLRWMEATAANLLDVPPVSAVVVTLRDVTARKQTEEKLRFLVELNQRLTPLAKPEEIMAVTARMLGEYLGVNRCAYAEVATNEDDFFIFGDYTQNTFSIVGSFKMSDFGEDVHRRMLANEPYVVDDVFRDPRTEGFRASYEQTDIASVICLPLHKDGKFAAAMAVHQKTPRRWTADEIELVQLVVNRCWEALERARTANQLRRSEERYRTLFNTIDEGFSIIELMFDAQGMPYDYRFVDTNPSFEKHTGLVDPVGKTIKELLPDIEQHWIEIYGNVARTGIPVRFENEARTLGRWYDVYSFRLGGNDSRQVAMLFNDVTERRRAEHRLLESEQRFRALADDATVMMFQADEQARITYANKAYLDFVGLNTVKEFEGYAWQTVMHPDDVQRINDVYLKAAASREAYQFEHRIMEARTGEYRWLLSQGKPRFTPGGEFVGYMGSMVDVTERKAFVRELEARVEERTRQLVDTNERLERSNAELEQFAYIASHDLQEPLRKIKTFADRLNRNAAPLLDETNRGYLDKITGSANRMHSLIHDVLEYSKLSHATEPFMPVDLNAVLANVLGDFELVVEQTNAAVTREALPTIDAVALQMNQLFTNLVGNALKFTAPDRTPTLRVGCQTLTPDEASRLELEADRTYFDITFTDNGIGFDAQYAEQIFVIFQRLHGKHQYGGTGIGLALCRRIASTHQGVVFAESKENYGATFHVVLPRQQRNSTA